jgi:hypothetical protein
MGDNGGKRSGDRDDDAGNKPRDKNDDIHTHIWRMLHVDVVAGADVAYLGAQAEVADAAAVEPFRQKPDSY